MPNDNIVGDKRRRRGFRNLLAILDSVTSVATRAIVILALSLPWWCGSMAQ